MVVLMSAPGQLTGQCKIVRARRLSLLLRPPRLRAMIFCAAICGGTAHAAGPQPVVLGVAKTYVILSQTGITDVRSSAVLGNVGTSPITGAADHLTCSEVTGKIFAVDKSGPAPCSLKKPAALKRAIGAMQTAYANAAGRTPNVLELGAGNIGGLTLAPGTYKWSTNLLIPTNVTLQGSAHDVWIFQVAQNVDIASATQVVLSGGASARNIFWQVAGQATLGTGSQFQGTILCATQINMRTGASLTGRLYAMTAVTLQKNTVSMPGR